MASPRHRRPFASVSTNQPGKSNVLWVRNIRNRVRSGGNRKRPCREKNGAIRPQIGLAHRGTGIAA